MNVDVAIVGGGLVGSSIAFGLVKHGVNVLVLDGFDRDFRASNANGGLVWQHTKGLGNPPYQMLTRRSVDSWDGLKEELQELVGIDVRYNRTGGLSFCLGDEALESRRADLQRFHNQLAGNEGEVELLDRITLESLIPRAKLGPRVTGASYCRRDGFANPLLTLSALHLAIQAKGGTIFGNAHVHTIKTDAAKRFMIYYGSRVVIAERLVIAAGLETQSVAAQVGLEVPIKPQRGQILITEPLEPFLPMPILGLAQMPEGTVMIGTTHEDVGCDAGVTADAAGLMSSSAVEMLPAMATVKVVRQWAGLRVMTPDGYPIYAQSESHPGAFVVTCHSGVTLAAAHATSIAEAISIGTIPREFEAFHPRRFTKAD
jgi:glycine/D-amino acid oxidase-like deaminating enzyme